MYDSYYSIALQKYLHVGSEHNHSLCCTWLFLGHRLIHNATIREAQEKNCLYIVLKDCERWPEGTLKAAKMNLRRVEEYEATLTSD